MSDMSTQLPEICRLPGCHEPFSAISHLVGAVVFLILGIVLLREARGDRARQVYLGVYAFACVFLFSMSGVYHMMTRGSVAHQVMERLDHSAIFVLVAGTFTPIHGLLFRGWLRWGPLVLIWTGAAAGIILKTVFFEHVAEWVGLSLYLALGWVGVFGAFFLARQYGVAFIRLVVLGGIVYSLGAVMEYFGWLTLIPGVLHSHDLFHLTVLVAALLHWRFIWQIAVFDAPASHEGLPARTDSMPTYSTDAAAVSS